MHAGLLSYTRQQIKGIKGMVTAKGVRFDDSTLWVDLTDGRTVGVPLAWLPRLEVATHEQRSTSPVSRRGTPRECGDSNISIVGHLAGHGALPNCSVGSGSSQPADAYDSDFILWARDEAAKLRSGRLDCLDVENVAEELDALARSLRRELVDRLARLLQHLVQWEYLSGVRQAAWYVAIVEERGMIPRILEDAPSLAEEWNTIYTDAWQSARSAVSDSTGITASFVPEQCPYAKAQLLSNAFWPGARAGE